MARTIVHVDMDAYFASVEQQEVPALRGKPVIVCGDPKRRGVVATASYEARKLGIRTGMPIQQARSVAPQAFFIEGDPQKYVAVSLKILGVLCGFSPLVEPYSIDEAFIDMTGCAGVGDPLFLAAGFQERVKRETGLSCSVGVGPNKLLAKMATEFKKPGGLTVLKEDEVRSHVWPLPVEKLYGIGPAAGSFFHSMGIHTIGALAAVPQETLKKIFGVNGILLWESARGTDRSPVDPAAALRSKSCGHEITFTNDTDDLETIQGYLLHLCDNVAHRMRRDGYRGRTVTLKLRDSAFQTITRETTRNGFTDDADEIYEDATRLLRINWKKGKLRLIGVSVSNLFETALLKRQLDLFGQGDRRRALASAIDKLSDKYGDGIITRASLMKLASERDT